MIKRILAFLSILILSLTAQAWANGPRLTLLFCANTDGKVRPCPS